MSFRRLPLHGLLAATIVAQLAAGACAPRVNPSTVPSNGSGLSEEQDGPPRLSKGGADPALPRVAQGDVTRKELNSVLDAGPARFLRGLEVRASFEARRFNGWEIVTFFPNDPRYARVDLVPGDVVYAVNGKSIQRPEEFQDVWESLRFASSLTVDYRRAGAPRSLVYAVLP